MARPKKEADKLTRPVSFRLTEADYAAYLAEKVRQCVQELTISHRFQTQETTKVTLSAGISALDKLDIDSAICAADAALYRAKNCGRNNIQLASSQLAM